MLIPTITSVSVSQVPTEQRSWVQPLITPINTFLTAATLALTGRLTDGDNIMCQKQTLSFTWNGSNLPLLFTITLSSSPGKLEIVSATENNNPVCLQSAWGINQSNQVQITNLTKLNNGTPSSLVSGANYVLNVRIYP